MCRIVKGTIVEVRCFAQVLIEASLMSLVIRVSPSKSHLLHAKVKWFQ
jgi:hypothetical protein